MGVPLSGGTPSVLGSAPRPVVGIASDGTNVYFTVGDSQGGVDTKPSDAMLLRVPLQGGSVETLASSLPEAGGVTVTADYVYWTNQGDYFNGYHDTGKLMRLAKSGGSPEIVSSGITEPTGLLVDATGIVWESWWDVYVRGLP